VNWEAVGAIGEVFGAIGVIVTLAYLAMQIRQNSRLVANSLNIANRESRSEMLARGTELNRLAVENPVFASLRVKLRTPSPDLTAEEREQAVNWALMQMNYWSLVSISFGNDLLSESEFQTQLRAARRIARLYPGMFELLVEVVGEAGFEPEQFSIYARVLSDV
jgi:hypothetical protein